jgi:hypothetical protein
MVEDDRKRALWVSVAFLKLCNLPKTNSCWNFYLFHLFVYLFVCWFWLLHSFSELFIFCVVVVWRSQCSLGRFRCEVHYTRMNWKLVCVYSGTLVSSQVSQFSQRKWFYKTRGGVRMFKRERKIDRLISNLINSRAFTRPPLVIHSILTFCINIEHNITAIISREMKADPMLEFWLFAVPRCTTLSAHNVKKQANITIACSIGLLSIFFFRVLYSTRFWLLAFFYFGTYNTRNGI